MGRDKALLIYNGELQVRRVASMLDRLAPPAYVSVRSVQAADPAFEGLPLLPDQEEGIEELANINDPEEYRKAAGGFLPPGA